MIINENDEKIPEMSLEPGAVGQLDDNNSIISSFYFSLFIFWFDVDLICKSVLYVVQRGKLETIHYTLEAPD